ncbi:MAG: hypothetical protein PQ612_04755 [Rickettsiales bacterium]|nr:hypothetical protein [Pseudomonadota bacterium]MDA0966331.1 hypothetical protein [Pseudomonadota bacterium]MDG4543963.1 hypothetical protein [Rickettsiales bacterium]MDG4545457.1 hypothetical protein [Rickettsiales bacterium]MDG4547906.1 hypothetical protein [Rickettsiales bacterium]
MSDEPPLKQPRIHENIGGNKIVSPVEKSKSQDPKKYDLMAINRLQIEEAQLKSGEMKYEGYEALSTVSIQAAIVDARNKKRNSKSVDEMDVDEVTNSESFESRYSRKRPYNSPDGPGFGR